MRLLQFVSPGQGCGLPLQLFVGSQAWALLQVGPKSPSEPPLSAHKLPLGTSSRLDAIKASPRLPSIQPRILCKRIIVFTSFVTSMATSVGDKPLTERSIARQDFFHEGGWTTRPPNQAMTTGWIESFV